MLEWVAVVWGGGALSGGSHMRKYEIRRGLGGNSLQVGVVPGGCSRCEDAGLCAQLGTGVVAYAEAIGIICSTSRVLSCGHVSQCYTGG